MACVYIQLTSHGLPVEVCHGCNRRFSRGEQMNGVQDDDGDGLGWHCDECVQIWRTEGEDKLPRWHEASEKQTL